MEDKPLHILHLPRWYPSLDDPQNGVFIQKQILATAEYCQQSVLFVGSSKKVDTPTITVLESFNYKEYQYLFPHKNKYRSFFLTTWGFLVLTKKIISERGVPDIIHAHILLRAFLYASLLKLRYNVPLVFSEHWSGYHYGSFSKRGVLYRLVTKLAYRFSDKVLVVSQRLGSDIVGNRLTNSFEVVPNVVTPAVEHDVTRNSMVTRFVTVADLTDNIKNISSIIAVFKSFPDGLDYEYHIIGDGRDRSMLEQLAGKLLGNKIFFHGLKANNEVLEMLKEFDVLVSNSRYETFGVVVVEALTAGLPVVCTKQGCPEILLDLPVGIFIDSESNTQLSNALIQMVNGFQSFRVKEYVKTIIDDFSQKTIGSKLTATYLSLATTRV